MNTRILTLTVISLLLTSSVFAAKFNRSNEIDVVRRMEVRSMLRQIATHCLMYASDNKEQFPSSIEDIRDKMKDDEKLIEFVADPNFSYDSPGINMSDIKKETVVCSYRFPDIGREVVYGYGNAAWINE